MVIALLVSLGLVPQVALAQRGHDRPPYQSTPAAADEIDDETTRPLAPPILVSARDDQEAETQGRESLKSLRNPSWYDSEKDSIRSLDPPKIEEDKGSRGTWTTSFDPTKPTTATTTGGGWSFWEILSYLFTYLVYVSLAALFLTVAYLLFSYFKAAGYFGEGLDVSPSTDSEEVPQLPVDRIEELPFEVRTVRGNLLDEARECYERGDYNRAVVYLYGYKLVKLDNRHHIELTKGKTNRQYLWELRGKGEIKTLIEPIVLAFEDSFFGHHDLDRARFESLWKNVDRFHQLLEQPA